MIRRHVDGYHRLGGAGADHRELLREKTHHPAAVRVLDHHDALEAVLVVGRKGRHELLHRRVDRPEDRDHRQPALRSREQTPADDIGSDGPHRQDYQQRDEHAQSRQPATKEPCRHWGRETINDTEDPHQRGNADHERHGDEEARQKRPPQPRHHSHPFPAAARMSTPMTMRYQANGANPDLLTNRRKGSTTTRAATNAMTKPTAISPARSGAR